MNDLLNHMFENAVHIFEDLRDMVNKETPSTSKPLLDNFSRYLSSYGESMTGSKAEIIPSEVAGDSLVFRISGTGSVKPLLLLAHYDTVGPEGTIDRMPFITDGNVATGPGIFDMKGGIVQAMWAIKTLREFGYRSPPLTLLLNSDEEIGSPYSRDLIESEARKASIAIVLEPSQNGKVKTGRKGVGRFTIRIKGKSSHAGLDHKEGVSAIDEMARVVLYLHSLTDYSKGTTLNVGVVNGGTRSNVVADEATAELDLRIERLSEAETIISKIMSLKPQNRAARIEIDGGLNRPPMERTERNVGLFRIAKDVAATLGLDLEDCVVGGGSDGNFCSALGLPVLDGMGPVGGNAHAEGEFVKINEMPVRAALLTLLLNRFGEI